MNLQPVGIVLVCGIPAVVQAILIAWILYRYRRATEAARVASYRHKLLRWALKEITQRRTDCGCSPCTGACRSAEIENEFRIEIAEAALRVDETMAPLVRPPLPVCEKPTAHAGVNASHHAFMDRLTCRCHGCVKWRDLTRS